MDFSLLFRWPQSLVVLRLILSCSCSHFKARVSSASLACSTSREGLSGARESQSQSHRQTDRQTDRKRYRTGL